MEGCIAENYMNKGDLAIKGNGARSAVLFIRMLCNVQKRGQPEKVTVQGKTYYKVIPGQIGNDVCNAANLNCVGLTPEKDSSICESFHPGVATQNIVHASRHYWYCSGQDSLACAGDRDMCKVCEACNPNIDCNLDPGIGWGNEIYVECGSSSTYQARVHAVLVQWECVG